MLSHGDPRSSRGRLAFSKARMAESVASREEGTDGRVD